MLHWSAWNWMLEQWQICDKRVSYLSYLNNKLFRLHTLFFILFVRDFCRNNNSLRRVKEKTFMSSNKHYHFIGFKVDKYIEYWFGLGINMNRELTPIGIISINLILDFNLTNWYFHHKQIIMNAKTTKLFGKIFFISFIAEPSE